jgi:transketolase
MENECDWHGTAPNNEQYIRAMQELGIYKNDPILLQNNLYHQEFEKVKRLQRESLAAHETLKSGGPKSISTREAYGEVLAELGAEIPNLVVLEADISKSTRTKIFAEKFPDRFYQFGIAEANMMTAAAGLATTGKIPFVSTYAVFASMRACEQLRTFICYPHLNVKVAVSHGGITSGNDGVTHQATEDLGMLRTIPGLTIIMPADYYATRALVREAAKMKGPVYLRFTRDAMPIIYGPGEPFTIGQGKLLLEGNDISLIAIGDMVTQALHAAEELAKQGIRAEVIDMHTLKPLDCDLVLKTAKKTGKIVTIEDHQINGGLGGAVCEYLAENSQTPVKRIGLKDIFAESGRYDLLLSKYEMSYQSIANAAVEFLKK